MHEGGIVCKANKQNKHPKPNLLSKEGCQSGPYYGEDTFANVLFW